MWELGTAAAVWLYMCQMYIRHLRRRNYSHMTDGPFINNGESRQGLVGRAAVSLAVMTAHRVSLYRVWHGKTARNFVFALGRTPLRPQGHVCDQIRSLAHEFPVAEATTMWEICFVDQGEPLVSIVCVLSPLECHYSSCTVSYTHLTLPTNREV